MEEKGDREDTRLRVKDWKVLDLEFLQDSQTAPYRMSAQSQKDELSARFRTVFEEKKASGLASNVAAVEALRWLEAMSTGKKTQVVTNHDKDDDKDDDDDGFVGELEGKLKSSAASGSWGQAMSLIYKVFSSIDELDMAFATCLRPCKYGRKRKRTGEEDDCGLIVRAARACYSAITDAAKQKEAVGKTLDNALDGLALEFMARQGDAKATTAWMVALEYQEINDKPKLLRSVLISLGACGGAHREAFITTALRSASPAARRSWGKLAVSFFKNLVTKGAFHSEMLVAARCVDVLREVDDQLEEDLADTVTALNDRLADEEHIVHDAYRAWLPDEPRGGGGIPEDVDVKATTPEKTDDVPTPDKKDDDGGEKTTPAKKPRRGSLVFPPATAAAMRLHRAGTSLLSYPYLLDAASKASFLRAESRGVMRQAARHELQRTIATAQYRAAPFLAIRVRRSSCVQDALSSIVAAKDDDLRKQLKVQFHGEDGVDEGGVANEFMHIVTKELLSPDHGMFVADDESNALWFARRSGRHRSKRNRKLESKRETASEEDAKTSEEKVVVTQGSSDVDDADDAKEEGLDDDAPDDEEPVVTPTETAEEPTPPPTTRVVSEAKTEDEAQETKKKEKRRKRRMSTTKLFELVGILLGVAIHNSILVDAPFAKYLFKKLLDPDLDPTLDDLADAAPALARSLRAIQQSSLGTEKEPFEVLYAGLSFEVGYDSLGSVEVAELVPGGSSIAVTRENAAEYVQAYVRWYFDDSVKSAFTALKKGFDRVVEDGHVWRLLTPQDLELLIRGSPTLDFAKLQSAATYEDGYTADSETIQHFWHVVDGLPQPDKLKLLKFVTGSDRAPIRGLGAARFVISRSAATDQLPSSHTCFSHLVLPDYKNIDTLRTKLQIAITESYEGFGLR